MLFCCFFYAFSVVYVVCLSMKTKTKVVGRPHGEEMLDEGGSVGVVDDVGVGCPSPHPCNLESILLDTSMDVDRLLDYSQSVCQGAVTRRSNGITINNRMV